MTAAPLSNPCATTVRVAARARAPGAHRVDRPGARRRQRARVGWRRFRLSAENFLVAREETREVLGFPWCDARARLESLDPRYRQRARSAAAGGRPARLPRRRCHQHQPLRRACSSRIIAKCPQAAGRRGARLPPLQRGRVFRFAAADDCALRALSRGRIPPRPRRAGRCSACARCSRAPNSCRRPPPRRAAR